MFEAYRGYINFLIMKKSQKLKTLEFEKLTISKLNQNQIKGGIKAALHPTVEDTYLCTWGHDGC
jgi:hypothetical protein